MLNSNRFFLSDLILVTSVALLNINKSEIE